MGKLITWLKALVDWAGTVITLIGWLGWTAAITGIFTAVGGAVWAVVRGVPVPIAIMAGYCTLAGGVVLAIAPVAYGAFARIAAASVPQDAASPQKPNADVWRHVPKFTSVQAACLLANVVPSERLPPGDALAWFETLRAAVQSKEIVCVSSLSARPFSEREINREELQRFAERHGSRPRFLFPV